ncbi:hypothetical protein PsYK624_058490 [Phanerochaete sordida]|uniref:Uncharacterized protein n=1 Tax=Phanerochaete sordida TaxID=48140 RepID=A0A9P3LCY0_9APHY|nr:hypothetical protein PsYK624_058490 [Phanerochaete sordida]
MSSCAALVYAEQLVGRGYGLPLWHPEPIGPFGDVQIGDVGYISEGAFIRLFNALHSKDDPINADGVPAGFSQLRPNGQLLRSSEQHVSPGPICTTTTTYRKISASLEGSDVAGALYTFSCNSSRGAVAVLGDSGHQEWYLRNRSFREYIAKYHSSWYDFALAKDHDIAPESLVLVSGWLKTSEWAIATFANQGKGHDISLNACAGSFASAAFEVSAGIEVQTSLEQRAGPPKISSAPVTSGSPPRNQCMFIRYYKLKTRALGRAKVSVQVDAKDMQSPWQEVSPSYGQNRGSTSSSTGDSAGTSRSWLTRLLGEQRTASNRSNPWRQASATGQSSGKSGHSSVKSGFSQVEEMPQVESLGRAYDPIECTLDYILQRSEANVAVVCHEDAYEAFASAGPLISASDEADREDLRQHLARRMPEIEVDDEGVGRLSLQSRGEDITQFFRPEQDVHDGTSKLASASKVTGYADAVSGRDYADSRKLPSDAKGRDLGNNPALEQPGDSNLDSEQYQRHMNHVMDQSGAPPRIMLTRLLGLKRRQDPPASALLRTRSLPHARRESDSNTLVD